ncbi:hypothetical protein [Ferrimonas kyonanensis]|uniref:hypothetical protein n=1 Tax=Ferrimonas kyonanensis TaxID=364763 RepID=UPI0004820F09|nr:hypothetical protein [Ferrimonas kyonanensis]
MHQETAEKPQGRPQAQSATKPHAESQLRKQRARKPVDDSSRLSEAIKLFTAEKIRVKAWKPHEEAHNDFAYRELIKIVGDIRLSQFDGRVALKYKQHFLSVGNLSVAITPSGYG